ncbi:MAG TPA: ABC transporter substrate-binding protein [Acidimicrobiales bacterium]|nr:ABC transporter substrate-binding protein [Acidimicrobiales bacterium]
MTDTVRGKGETVTESFDRRAFLAKAAKGGAAFTLLGAGGTVLDACGGNGSSSSSKTTTTLSKAKAVQIGVNPPPKGTKLGGSVTMGTEAEESGMDPTEAHFDSTGVCYARAVYDPLAMVTFDGDVVPYLAESIVPNKTFTEWTITLRPGLYFHDGTPCDGAALTFCMQRYQASGLVNFALTYWKANGASQSGPLSCTISMTDPWVAFPAWLAGYIGGQVAYVFSPTQYRKSESLLNTQPVGTGPFKFVKWEVNNFITFERNPHYWRKDALGRQLPYLDSWTYKPLPDVTTRYDALDGGTLQIMHTDDDPTIILMEANKKLNVLLDDEVRIGEPDCNFGMVNTADPTMKDLRLRQALAYSFSQPYYCTDIGKGLLEPITGPFSAPSPYYAPVKYPAYDPAKAKSLVASWSADHGGAKPTIRYTTTSTPESLTSADFTQEMFEAAGFTVDVGTVQQSALIDDALFGSYQVFAWRQFANIDPDLNYVFWSSTGGAIDFSRNDDPIIDAALDTARQTTDPATRIQAYQTVADRFAVDLPYIWASRDVWSIGASTSLQNWNNPTTVTGARGCPMISGIIWPTEMWLDNT